MTEEKYKMRNIPIKNKELLGILDKFIELRTSDVESFEKYLHLMCLEDKQEEPDKYISDEYLQEVIEMGREHDGFPKSMHGYEFRTNHNTHRFFHNEYPKDNQEAIYRDRFVKKLSKVQTELCDWLSCRNNALTACYPPGGYIGWHNNANASAYNFIFTWSETGDGYFKYWDIEKKEIVYMYDQPGWQLKAGYFGHYDEPDKIFYHSASTECWRQTVSYCYERGDLAGDFREEIIDEIMSE